MDNQEDQMLSWKRSQDSEESEALRQTKSLPLIVQPQTPKEPMEFLSRSWSISAEEISKALAKKQKHFLLEKNPCTIPEAATSPPQMENFSRPVHHTRRMGAIGKWFHHHRDSGHGSVKKKDKARAENAHMHAAVSIAGLAAALAAVTTAESSNSGASKMSGAVASAAELLASHCIENAEMAGADHDRVASVVRSAVDVRSPGDLMTLTAAAATALRGEAALRARLPKEPKRTATISPFNRSMTDIQYLDPFQNEIEDLVPPCAGELLQHTRSGALRWKRVYVYINKKSQVIIKLKSKHVGGALSKNDKCLVYGVCDQTAGWPCRNTERENLEAYFGLKTAQGFLEFKCKNKLHKQQWIDGIRSLLHQVGCNQDVENDMDNLSVSNKH